MKLQVKPIRTELLKLRLRLKLAKRGHELLKQRRDELMRRFMEAIKDAKMQRQKVEKIIEMVYRNTSVARALMDENEFESTMKSVKPVHVEIGIENIGGIKISRIAATEMPEFFYGLARTPDRLNKAASDMRRLFPEIIKLAEIERTIHALADEISITRRRVNALERIIIPRIEETLKYIEMKLDEREREEFITRKKVKELVS